MITKYPWLVLATGFLLYVDGFSQVESLRFAWLSDTHVGSTTGAEDLRAAIHDINAMNDIQFTIVSGDVTEIGSNDELLAAKTLLDSLERPYYIIPGNHDTRWSESGTTMFHRLWGDDKFTFEFGRFQFLGLHQGPRMKMGPGHWAPEDLRWLDSVLTDLPDKKRPLFIVTHYPVVPWITNWYELLERVKKFNTQAIFVGHGHTNRIDNYEGVPGVMARSTLRGVDSVGGFTIVETRADTVYFSERRTGVQSKPPWHRAILEEQTYRNDTISYPRPDFSMNLRFPRVRTRWKFTSGFTIGSTPAIWKEIAIVGDASGTVYGLALKDGDVRWRFRTGGPVYSSPDVSNGFVVFGSCDSYVYCLDAVSGRELWRYKTSAPVVSAPRIAKGLVYVGGSDQKFRAIDITSGNLAWEFDGLEGHVETRPVEYEGKVIFGAWDTHLYALDAQNGTLVWKWRGDRPGIFYSPAACWPVTAYDAVFIVAPDRRITAIDVRSGRELWRTGSHQVRESIGISEDGKRFYVRTMRDSIIALSTSVQRPEIDWSADLQFGYDVNSAMLVEKDSILFYGTADGLLLALEAETGRLKWKHRTGVAMVNTVTPISRREVVLSNSDGEVILIESGDFGER